MKNILKRVVLTLSVIIISSAAVVMITKAFTKGDLLVATDANNLIRVPIGTDGQFLQASSSAASGVAWASLPSGTKKYEISDGSIKALYRLEDGTDSSGNGFNLTNNGSTLFTGGKLENAVDFGNSNTSKYLSVANDLGITGGSISFSTWINVATPPATDEDKLFVTHGDAGTHIWEYLTYSKPGGIFQLQARRHKSGGSADTAAYSITLTPGAWYHVVYTYDGSNVKLYLNNTEVASVASNGNGASGVSDDFQISGQNNDVHFSGMVDETVVFNTAISTTTIYKLYNGGNGKEVCITAGCGN